MDIQRPSNARAKKIRRIIYGTVTLLLLGGVTYGLSKLRPAAPSVDRATVWPDEVKRGPMVRDVHGLGTLVPEDMKSSSVERAFALLDEIPEVEESANPRPLSRAAGRIAFLNVSFAYVPDRPALDRVSFELSPGMCAGILDS